MAAAFFSSACCTTTRGYTAAPSTVPWNSSASFDQAVAGVQINDAEHLVAPPGELQAQEPLDVLGRGEGAPGTVARRKHGQGEFDDGGFLGLLDSEAGESD